MGPADVQRRSGRARELRRGRSRAIEVDARRSRRGETAREGVIFSNRDDRRRHVRRERVASRAGTRGSRRERVQGEKCADHHLTSSIKVGHVLTAESVGDGRQDAAVSVGKLNTRSANPPISA